MSGIVVAILNNLVAGRYPHVIEPSSITVATAWSSRLRCPMASTPRAVFSIKNVGTGLNLPVANQIFPFDRWRNPVVEGQVMDHSWRIDW
jgi:hypothetical protein